MKVFFQDENQVGSYVVLTVQFTSINYLFHKGAWQGIGTTLCKERKHTYRELLGIHKIRSEELVRLLQCQDTSTTLWARHYAIWTPRGIQCLILEVLSPGISHYTP